MGETSGNMVRDNLVNISNYPTKILITPISKYVNQFGHIHNNMKSLLSIFDFSANSEKLSYLFTYPG